MKFILDSEFRWGIDAANRFASMLNKIENSNDPMVIIDMTKYKFINVGFAVLLSAMFYVKPDKSVILRYNANDAKCVDFLKNSGMMAHFKNNREELSKNSISFGLVKDLSDALEISKKLINHLPVFIKDDDFKANMISNTLEIISNSFYHSNQEKVFFGGSFANDELIFSIYDLGIGIPNNVKRYKNDDNIIDVDALKWAWGKGNSTLNDSVDYLRGAGFQTLESFARENQGQIFLCSGKSCCKARKGKVSFYKLENSMLGTFFSMKIKKDFKHVYELTEGHNIKRSDFSDN